MVYGIISVKDNQTSLAYFKSKKLSQGKLVTADRLQKLANVLTAGDVIHVVSIDRFPSVNVNRLVTALKLTGAGKEYVIQCVTDITIGILAKTYASDGILHCGN